MHLNVCPLCDPGPISDFQMWWTVSRHNLRCLVNRSGKTKGMDHTVAGPQVKQWLGAECLMVIMRYLQINLVYGERKRELRSTLPKHQSAIGSAAACVAEIK